MPEKPARTRRSNQILRSHRGLLDEIGAARRLADDPDRARAQAVDVSHWNVLQHLEHLLLTDAAIAQGLEQGLGIEGAGTAGGNPTAMGSVILWTGRIPRGRAQAPDFVVPEAKPREEIRLGLETVRERFENMGRHLDHLGGLRTTIPHPLLGHFNAGQWLRFGHIHHLHHGGIIRDILRSA